MPEPNWAGRDTSGSRGDGAGSGGVQAVHVTIPHAEILTLYSVPKVLVEPTEILDYDGLPATIPWPLACTVIGISGTGGSGYVLAGTYPNLSLKLSTGEDVRIAKSRRVVKVTRALIDTSGADLVADSAVDIWNPEPYVWLPSAGHTAVAAQFDLLVESLGVRLDGNLQDNGLVISLSAETGADDPTGGDASNRLEVFLTYTVLDLS